MYTSAFMETEVTLRAKNQFTLPDKIARKLGLKEGDKLIIFIDENEADEIHIRRVPDSYYGAATGAWGDSDRIEDYVKGERDAWE